MKKNIGKQKGFTLIELLVVVAILGILASFGVVTYNDYTTSAKCSTSKHQHNEVVKLAELTYSMCPINGWTYMNVPAGFGCNSQKSSGMTAVGVGANGKCIRKWDCTSDWVGRTQNAGLSSGWFFSHVNAEFGMYPNTDSFVRNDQWQNFLKPNYPERVGITNIRDKGNNMHIATYLGDCSGGDYTNSSGSYLINEIVWP
tara:strand:- start:105 stop:704 length:600 start_codon:yes stop_codon:yes gene_type:complete